LFNAKLNGRKVGFNTPLRPFYWRHNFAVAKWAKISRGDLFLKSLLYFQE